MNIIAIDTTMAACSVAIRTGGGSMSPSIHFEHKRMERGHAEELIPMIQRVRDAAQIDLHDLDRIAVTSGPGTFTGVRIGIAAARGLAFAAGCGMFSETSLRIIALNALREFESGIGGRPVVVAVDARRGDVYIQAFDNTGVPLDRAQAATLSSAIDLVKGTYPNSIIVGSAAPMFAQEELGARQEFMAQLSDIQPDARDLAEVAAGVVAPEEHVSPLYLRPPDAKSQSGKAISRIGSGGPRSK